MSLPPGHNHPILSATPDHQLLQRKMGNVVPPVCPASGSPPSCVKHLAKDEARTDTPSAPFSLPPTEPPLLVVGETSLRFRSYNDQNIHIQQYFLFFFFFFYHNQVTAGTGCAALPQTLEKKLMGLKSVFIRIDFN